MKKTLERRLILAWTLCIFSATAWAQDVQQQEDIVDTRIYVAPMGSLVNSRRDRSDKDAYGGGIAIGKGLFPHFTFELRGDFLRYDGKTETTAGSGLLCGLLPCASTTTKSPSTNVYGGGLGVNGYVLSTNSGFYLHGDAEAGKRFVYNAGAGLDYPFWNHSLYVRGELLYHHEADFTPEPLIHLGIRIPFGPNSKPATPPAEAPVQVVPVDNPPPAEASAPAPTPAAQAPEAAPCQPPSPGQPISLEGCKTGDTLVLHGVNFEFNKAVLTLNAKTLLDQVADALLQRTDIKVEIDGHTDGVGGVAYNQKLSEARAKSVKKYLEGRGVAGERLSAKGFGKSMPIADNNTDEGREQNRRVELRVTESGAGGAPAAAAAPADAASVPPAQADTAPAPPLDAGTGLSTGSQAAAPPADAVPAPADAAPSTDGSSPQ